jgi:nucleotide-binding universal stress UspA family protein
MTGRHILCAVDFSDGSRTALRYAAVIAKHLSAQLTVMTVNDPLLVEAAQAAGEGDWPASQASRELRRFSTEALGASQGMVLEVRVGRAAEGILAFSAELPAMMIVMGAQGLTGLRKLFFGSTVERVLRETRVPVLVTPTDHRAPATVADLTTLIRRLVVPVDLTDAPAAQVQTAAALAATLKLGLLIVHAVEPLSIPLRWRMHVPHIDMERRSRAESAMVHLREIARLPDTEVLVVFGEPAEEITKVAAARAAGLIVMGLHASGAGRVGSVTYRVLSLAHVPVLALPPATSELIDVFAAGARRSEHAEERSTFPAEV